MARIGDSRLVYGTQDEVWGYTQSKKVERTSEKAEARNGVGNKIAVETFNTNEEKVTGSFYFLTGMLGGPFTEVGNVISVTDATGTVLIDKASKARQQANWCVIDFEGTYYPHLVNS